MLHGDELGLGDLSLLFSYNPPDGGPRVHRHSYIEIFVIQQGSGTYVIGNDVFEAGEGDIVVVPSGLPHTFKASNAKTLKHIAIHQAAHSVSEGV